MTVKLYYFLASPPARAVELTLKILDVPFELINVNLLGGEHKNEEFLRLNPQHTVPVIVDEDGFSLSESHAINKYLVRKYAKDDKLYPKELKARSIVDHRLNFDCGTLFQCVRSVAFAFFFEKSITTMTQLLTNCFVDVYKSLEKYLLTSKYIAADYVTIADFSMLTTLNNAQLFVPVDTEEYPNLSAYTAQGDAVIPLLKERNKAAINSLKLIFNDFNF